MSAWHGRARDRVTALPGGLPALFWGSSLGEVAWATWAAVMHQFPG
jgi:hypothetical protein